jgi:hypothetical protein
MKNLAQPIKAVAGSLYRDLVEKRLWPVAAALVIALFAIPFLLGRGGGAPPPVAATTAPAAGAAGADASAKAQVSLAEESVVAPDRPAATRNPFKSQGGAATASTPKSPTLTKNVTSSVPGAGATSAPSAAPVSIPASTGTASTGTSPSSTSPVAPVSPSNTPSGATGSSGTTTGSSSTPSVTPKPATTSNSATTRKTTAEKPAASTPTQNTHRVVVRFGSLSARRRTVRNVPRLKAFPSAKRAVASLLGVMRDGRTVAFLVGSNAAVSGSGVCKPSPTDCKTVELKKGDATYFHVRSAGGDRWYYLKLIRVKQHRTNPQVAAAAATRFSKVGRRVVRRASASVQSYRYLPAIGVLVRAKHTAGSVEVWRSGRSAAGR